MLESEQYDHFFKCEVNTTTKNLRRSSKGSAAIKSDLKDIALSVINLNENL